LAAGGCSSQPAIEVRLASAEPGVVFISNVSLLDVEQGEMLSGRDVLLAGGRIEKIAVTGEMTAATGALEVDGTGLSLVPGLIDMHGHIETSSTPLWQMAMPDAEANLRSYLYCGVTTLLDPGDSSGDAFGRRERVARGELVGPRIFTAGPILTSPDGHPIAMMEKLAPWWISWYIAPRVAIAIGSVYDADATVDELAADGADFVKIVVDRVPLTSRRMSPGIAKAITARASERGLRVVAHVGTTQDAIDAAEGGVALWVHGVYKESIPEADVARLAGYGIPMVATIEVFDNYARANSGPRKSTKLERETVPKEILDAFHPVPADFDTSALREWLDLNASATKQRSENVRRLHEAGVTILAGSDTQSGVFPGPGLHRELAKLVAAGLTPVEAIRAATWDAARFLANGAEPDFGAVREGLRADLVLVEGDPSVDVSALENIRQVYLGGIPVVRSSIAAVAP
jgi:imidazolonepropionase-like amidohydrolase